MESSDRDPEGSGSKTSVKSEKKTCKEKGKRSTDDLQVSEPHAEVKRQRISEQSEGPVCEVHQEKYKMFCIEDQKLVCSICMSQDHKDHNFHTISKAAEDRRNDLQGPLQELQKKLKTLRSTKELQTQQTEKQIKEEFEKLHQFLREEEQVRINALRDEEPRQKKEMLKKSTEIEKLISDLTERINQIEEDLKHEDSLFLHKFRETEKRVKLSVPDPELSFSHHVDVVKHLGNLRFRLWEKMKDFCPHYPVVLDPNTKSSNLQVSPDLTSTTCAPTPGLQNPPNPHLQYVLGSEGFSSGVHTWQVDVNYCEHWALGIVKESSVGTENIPNTFYTVSVINGKCSWSSGAPNIKKVQVYVDMGTGQLRFTDPDTNTVLKSLIGDFTEKMYPCFFIHGDSSLRILPAATS